MDIKKVEKIAALARIEFTSEEKERISKELVKIFDYIEKLNELDIENVRPIGHPHNSYGHLVRKLKEAEDEVEDFKEKINITNNSPDFYRGYYRIKKVIK